MLSRPQLDSITFYSGALGPIYLMSYLEEYTDNMLPVFALRSTVTGSRVQQTETWRNAAVLLGLLDWARPSCWKLGIARTLVTSRIDECACVCFYMLNQGTDGSWSAE